MLMRDQGNKDPARINELRQQWLGAVRDRVRALLLPVLTKDSSMEDLTKAVGQVACLASDNIGLVEKHAEEQRKSGVPLPQIACKSGCNFCCYVRVKVSIPEVIAIAEAIRAGFTEDELQALLARIDSNLAAFSGLDATARLNKMVACPLLVDGKCSIYAHRPVRCRSQHSVDVTKCEDAFHNPSKVQVPHILEVDMVIGPLLHSIARTTKESNLIDPGVMLPAALKIALEDSQAKQKWSEGQNVFAPAADDGINQLEEQENRRRMMKFKF